MVVRQETGVRRMAPEQRSDQLASVALSVLADGGYTALTLEEVADRAGVTRNLIYHYFPRGRQDLFLAAIDRAGRTLTDGWLTDEEVPIEERLAVNFSRFFDHALEPSDAWLVHRQGRLHSEPEVVEVSERYRSIVVGAISLNHFGTEDPSPLAVAALRAYLDFAERTLDECRERGLDRNEVRNLLAETLLAVVGSVRATDSKGSQSG